MEFELKQTTKSNYNQLIMEDWRWKNIQLEKNNIKKLYLGKQKYHKVE